MIIRRIWAIVNERDFYAFQTRARKDGVSMGAALTAVAKAYAKGVEFDMTKAKVNYDKMHTGVDYIKEKRLREVDKSLVGEEDQ